MTVTFHALWMLCALGAVVFAASAARRVQDIIALAIGLIAAVVLSSAARLPDAVWVGVLAAAAAALQLFRPRYAVVSAAFGGALGGMLTAMLEVQGLHPAASVIVALVVVATPIWLTRTRPAFAPDVLRDEALLTVCLIGLVVAMLPGVIDGWQAAGNLTVEPATPGPVTAIPAWTLTLVGTAMALGAGYSLWSRR